MLPDLTPEEAAWALRDTGYGGWSVEDFSEARESRTALEHNHAFVQQLMREQVGA